MAIEQEAIFEESSRYDIDFADVRGQEAAKRALTVAAAGGHNVIMVGPLGNGERVALGAFVADDPTDDHHNAVFLAYEHPKRQGVSEEDFPADHTAARKWRRGRWLPSAS